MLGQAKKVIKKWCCCANSINHYFSYPLRRVHVDCERCEHMIQQGNVTGCPAVKSVDCRRRIAAKLRKTQAGEETIERIMRKKARWEQDKELKTHGPRHSIPMGVPNLWRDVRQSTAMVKIVIAAVRQDHMKTRRQTCLAQFGTTTVQL